MGFSLGGALQGGATGLLVGGPIAGGIGFLGGGFLGGEIEEQQEAASEAAIEAQREAIAESRRQFDLSRGDILPFLEGGREGQDQLLSILRGETDFTQDPLLQAQLGLAGKQAGRFASAQGSLGTGAFQKDLLRGTSGVIDRRINQLLALSGRGQTAAGQLGQLGASQSANVGNRLASIGNIEAGLNIGRAQTTQNTLNNLLGIGALALR